MTYQCISPLPLRYWWHVGYISIPLKCWMLK